MGRVTILGSASAIPVAGHENTHLLVEAGSRVVLVDCPGTPVVRLQQAGVDPKRITDLILTHFHPDHVSGFASLLMSLWLLGRTEPLQVYGLQPTLDRAAQMMDFYDWRDWPGFYPVKYVPVAAEERGALLADADLQIYASPVEHMIPTLGLRFEFGGGSVLAYSCDTEPSQVVRRLAEGADVLIHEATGHGLGHSSPAEAGQIAAQAEVGALYLIHYPAQRVTPEHLLDQARQTYAGPVFVTQDFMTIDLPFKP